MKKPMPKGTNTTTVLIFLFFPPCIRGLQSPVPSKKEVWPIDIFGGMLTNSSFPLSQFNRRQNNCCPRTPSLQHSISHFPKFNFVCILRSSELMGPTNFSVHRVNMTDHKSCGTSYSHCLNTNLQPNSCCSVQTQNCKMVPCPKIVYSIGLPRSNEH